MRIKTTAFIFSLFLISFHDLSGQDSKAVMPKLQMLTRTEKSDSSRNKVDSTLKTTSDSAKIILPPIRTVISENYLPIEIVPRCSVDSVTILVRHSTKRIDTLGTFSRPPYKTVWNCEKIPDQDQMHLQVGYHLFHKSGLKIISPPLAHRWVLDREKKINRKKYHSYQNTAPDSASIDGVIDEWKGARVAKIGHIGNFKVLWSGTHIFFAARIIDSSVTYKDYIELHFDLYNNKAEFAGINHRSISFGPKLRSNCFTVNLTDSGFVLADSVNVLISREMRWAKKIYPDGYSIEVSLPIFVLSDLQYPGKTIGFDLSVINVDEGKKDESFTSWSGTELTNRYNPSQWGNMVLVQAMYPIRFAVVMGIILFFTLFSVIIGIQLVQFYKAKKIDNNKEENYSEFMKKILFSLQQSLSDPDLSSATIANSLTCTPDEIKNTIQKEAECTFEQLVNFQKVKSSRALLRDTEFSLEKIASMTGFKTTADFNFFFTSSTCVDPEKFRERIQKEAELESEENEED